MKRLALLLMLCVSTALPVFAQNLVVNGDFESGFYTPMGNEKVANGWSWWDAGVVNPIYPGSTHFWQVSGVPGNAQRIISGQIAGQSFRGGVYQVVNGTVPGVPHVFSFDYLVAGTTDPGAGQERRIGYDLTDGTDPNSPSIVWVVVEDATGDKPWQHFETTIVPTGTSVTIWTRVGIYWPVATTYMDIDNMVLKPVGYAIRGKVALGDFGGALSTVPVEAQLRAAGSTDPIRTVILALDDAGNYAIPDVAPGNYDVAFKASHWLRAVARNIQVVNADVDNVDVTLTNGDIDGDNEVTLFDFGNLVAAFGSVPGDSNWNPDADLDGDLEVTLFDFGVLVRNFGEIGEE